jgi:hypothetical protein
MADPLKRLRDAVTGRGREVEVAADGSVREVEKTTLATEPVADPAVEPAKTTKLAPRTFGTRS